VDLLRRIAVAALGGAGALCFVLGMLKLLRRDDR
jgi:hypothetical protein